MSVYTSVKCWMSLDAGSALFFNHRSRPARPFNLMSIEFQGGDEHFLSQHQLSALHNDPFWEH